MDPITFAEKLNELKLSGVRFIPCKFTPKERQFKDQVCGGVYIAISDWKTFDPIQTGLGLVVVLRANYKDQWKPEGLTKFLCDTKTYQAILQGQGVEELRSIWQSELETFLTIRGKYLIYPPK